MPQDIFDYAAADAIKEGRSISNWIRRLIEERREKTTNGHQPTGQGDR